MNKELKVKILFEKIEVDKIELTACGVALVNECKKIFVNQQRINDISSSSNEVEKRIQSYFCELENLAEG